MHNLKHKKTKRSTKNWKGVPGFYEQVAMNPDKVPVINIPRNEKMVQTLAALLGTICTVTLKNGTSYNGIYDYIDPISYSTKIKLARKVGEERLVSHMDILGQDIKSIEFAELDSLAADVEIFKTDAAISKTTHTVKERVLQKWIPEGVDTSLELDSNNEQWDQFAVNEKKFGVVTDFKEEIYTTTIDTSLPGFKEKEKEALRIAKEIENQSTKNVHLAQERNQIVKDMDEEELYSSVIRDKGKKYSEAMKAKPAPSSGGKSAVPTSSGAKPAASKPTAPTPSNAGKPSAPTSSAKPGVPPPNAAYIRKASIEQISGHHRSALSKAIKEEKTKPSGVPLSSIASQPQNTVEELKRNFKPFAKELKDQLITRKDEISKDGRKVLEELKQFSKEFHIPENLKKKITNPLEKKLTKVEEPLKVAKEQGAAKDKEPAKDAAAKAQSPTKPQSNASAKAPSNTPANKPQSPIKTHQTTAGKPPAPSPTKSQPTAIPTKQGARETQSASVDTKKSEPKSKRPTSEAAGSPEIPESVVSETSATSTTSKQKSFKLSAKAAEFTPKGFVPPLARDKNGKPYQGPPQYYQAYPEGYGYPTDPNMFYPGYPPNFRPYPPNVPVMPTPYGYPPPMFLPVGPDMRPQMYPQMVHPGYMAPPPNWYENMPRPVEVSAQEFQDETIETNDQAEEITQNSQ